MFRNQYDTDVTTFSPQGRLHQIEYAMEAVKQGSAVVGVRSSTHAVMAAVKRSFSDLASHQRKLFPIDDHAGVAISGITADARVLSKYMRTECLNHKYVYEAPLPVGRLVRKVADKCQMCTQRADKRPFGVGFLVIGVDELGPHVYETCPSGNYYEYVSMAIGARAQSAKTYLEKHFESFASADREQLVQHAVLALKETLAASKDVELDEENCAIAVVGRVPAQRARAHKAAGDGARGDDNGCNDKDEGDTELEPFCVYEGDEVTPYLQAVREQAAQRTTSGAADGVAAQENAREGAPGAAADGDPGGSAADGSGTGSEAMQGGN